MAKALIFDSGVGGLSVAAEIRTHLPHLGQIYVADDAFRPYGEKTINSLKQRLPGLIATLTEMCRPDIIVIACNTASTTALKQIRTAVDIPVVGVVPAIKPAAKASQSHVIGVLGTPGTVRRRYVDKLIRDFAAGCQVRLVGSSALVEQAELKLSGRPVDSKVIRAETAPLFEGPGRIDQVVLACTHFPLLRSEFEAAAPHPVRWMDSGAAIARRVAYLIGDDVRNTKPAPDVAFLIGPNPEPARLRAFNQFGFDKVVGLVP